jgi:hypothetical protein
VDISLGVVGSLVLLVDDGVLSGGGTAGKACIVVLGDVLVGLLGSCGTSALDSLSGVVGGVLEIKILATNPQNSEKLKGKAEVEAPKLRLMVGSK